MTTSSAYDRQFFERLRDGARRSAQVAVPLVLTRVKVNSVVDVGCGSGTWLKVFQEQGVRDILGIDGDYVEPASLEISASCFLPSDLTKPLVACRRFDLAMCLEVAEHLPARSAETLIESLVGLAPVVLFSAAAPHQGGTEHVNEQWPAYWAERFALHEYLPVDCLRRDLWRHDEVEWWYAQNALLYVQETVLRADPGLFSEHLACPTALSLIHPRRYSEWIEWGLLQMQQLQASEQRAAGTDRS
jgi:SAM-dependent methyltransferase